MRKIELNGRGWWRGSRPLNYEPNIIDDDITTKQTKGEKNTTAKLFSILDYK